MISPSVLRAMLAAGASAEMIVSVVEADYEIEQAKLAVKRARDAERQRNKRHAVSIGHRGVTRNPTCTAESHLQKENPPDPQKKNNIYPPMEANASIPPKPKRASRLPENWHPSDAIWVWAKEKLSVNDEFLRFETGAFRDHFWAAPGQRGVKIGWDSTWKNWMREAVRRRGNGRGQGPPRVNIKTSPFMQAGLDLIEEARARDEQAAINKPPTRIAQRN
jgi:hypothetical protein